MGSSRSRSRNKHRLDGISCTFKIVADAFDGKALLKHESVNITLFTEQRGLASQISEYPSFDHRGDSSNVLTNDPSGPDFANNAEHLRPEVTCVFLPPPLSCIGKRLAGEASGKDVNTSPVLSEVGFGDIFITV